MKRGFSIVSVLSLIGLLALACGGETPAEIEAHVHASCEKVNQDNWYASQWGERSPQEKCEQNAWVISNNMVPCTLGNVPFLCRDNGHNMGVYRLSGDPVAFLSPEDMTRVGDGLKFIR